MNEHGDHGHGGGHAEGHGGGHAVNYWAIFAILCVLTGVSALADLFGGEDKQAAGPGDPHATASHAAPASDRLTGKKLAVILVVMAVAIAKATFVIMYFMHVKFEGRWIYAMLLPTTVLALAIPAALLPDVGLHYYTVQTPQSEQHMRDLAGTEPEEHADPANHPAPAHKDAAPHREGDAHPPKAHK